MAIWEVVRNLSLAEAITAVIDVVLVAYVLYRLFILVRGTRAIALINGIIILAIFNALATWLNLYTMKWLLDRVWFAGAVALPVVFQPELRRALESLGRGRLFAKVAKEEDEADMNLVIDQVVQASQVLSRNQTGALVVIEREVGLNDLVETGIKIDAVVTWELLINTFIPNTPLHDGALIIRGNRAVAAACFLPLAEAAEVSHDLGTRHRAAIGVTEHSDAVVVVVSEETGAISIAQAGKLIRHLDDKTLREMLTSLLQPKAVSQFKVWNWGGSQDG